MKLATKFLLAFVLTSLVVLVASGYFRVHREIEHFDADMRQDAATFASALARAVTAVAESAGPERAKRLVARSSDSSRHLFVRWVSLDPNPASSLPRPGAPLPPRQQDDRAPGPQFVTHASSLYTYVPLELEVDLPKLGHTAIEVTESLEVRDRFVRGTITRTVVTMATTFGSVAVVALVLGLALIGRPLRAVSQKVRRVGAGDLASPLHLTQRDEIGDVARELNAMCEQLADSRRRLEQETAARIAALEQLRHADRLATVGRLASGIAHEIGTPLAVVAGRSKMIVTGESSGADAVHDARIALEQTQQISAIIRQLLDFARRRPARKGRVDVAALARKTASLVEPLAQKRGVTLAVHTPEAGTPTHAEIDAGQIGQALTNLLMNAIQATAAPGRVDVSVATPSPDAIAITVADTGSGMDADTVAHVFEPFFTTKDVGEGTGLGLPVAYGLVREHGGSIDVHSELGRGSRFTIQLPVGAEAPT